MRKYGTIIRIHAVLAQNITDNKTTDLFFSFIIFPFSSVIASVGNGRLLPWGGNYK